MTTDRGEVMVSVTVTLADTARITEAYVVDALPDDWDAMTLQEREFWLVDHAEMADRDVEWTGPTVVQFVDVEGE